MWNSSRTGICLARPASGSPSIVIVLMDDTGWADIGCYGSEIATLNIDALVGFRPPWRQRLGLFHLLVKAPSPAP